MSTWNFNNVQVISILPPFHLFFYYSSLDLKHYLSFYKVLAVVSLLFSLSSFPSCAHSCQSLCSEALVRLGTRPLLCSFFSCFLNFLVILIWAALLSILFFSWIVICIVQAAHSTFEPPLLACRYSYSSVCIHWNHLTCSSGMFHIFPFVRRQRHQPLELLPTLLHHPLTLFLVCTFLLFLEVWSFLLV